MQAVLTAVLILLAVSVALNVCMIVADFGEMPIEKLARKRRREAKHHESHRNRHRPDTDV